MSVTIKDIARVAGVSHATVSRALHNHTAISPETTTRIKRIAGELGYLPSAAARTLKTNRSHALGVVLSAIDDPYFSQVLEGIEDVLQPRGYSLFLAASHHDEQRELAIVRAMLERQVDGVIICSPPFRGEHGHTFQEYGLPLTVINNQDAQDYQYSIYHDDLYGGRQVARHLLDLGRHKIAYLGNINAGRSNQDRLQGYQTELRQAGQSAPQEYIFQGVDGTPECGYQGAQYFLGLADPPTAVMCFNDRMAIGLLCGLQEGGWCVPGDCSVAGFDNISLAAYTSPPLTTFDQPKYSIGSEAAQLMLKLLSSPKEGLAPRVIKLRGQLLVRGSTGPRN